MSDRWSTKINILSIFLNQMGWVMSHFVGNYWHQQGNANLDDSSVSMLSQRMDIHGGHKNSKISK